jgi:hypothetical protein
VLPLVSLIKANLHLFDEPNFRERLKDSAFVDSLAADVRRPDSSQLEKDLESVSKHGEFSFGPGTNSPASLTLSACALLA